MSTTAQTYFRTLVERFPLEDPSPDKLGDLLNVLEGSSLSQLSELEIDSRVSMLMDELSASLPAVAHQLLRDGHLVVGELGIEAPNAQLVQLDTDQFVVVLHSGLFAFLYRIARPLASAVFRPTADQGEGIDFPQFARIIAEVFWWMDATGATYGPGEYAITSEQKHLANILAMRAERFLLAHELGHVLFAKQQADSADPELFDGSMEEYIADATALGLTLNACVEEDGTFDPMQLMLTYAGAELSLQIWGAATQIGIDFVDSVHPPSNQRIAALRAILREWCGSEQQFKQTVMAAEVIGKAFSEVSQIINQPSSHAATFEREAGTLLDEFTDLLEQCSKERVPDYVTFYTSAPALLDRGYPESILNRVFVMVVERFNEAMRQLPGQADKAETIKRFSQYKLLFGLTERMPQPAKSLYDMALTRLIQLA
jgi:hypothetical protein